MNNRLNIERPGVKRGVKRGVKKSEKHFKKTYPSGQFSLLLLLLMAV